LILVLFLCILSTANSQSRVAVGVIRWDAWNQIYDDATKQSYYDTVSWYTKQTLTPAQYQYRLPFFASVNNGTISYNNDNQKIMDQEIQYAKQAGIDYFAFDTYCPFQRDCITTEPLCVHYIAHTSPAYCPQKPDYGLSLYLSSTLRHTMNFTLILLGAPVCRPGAVESYVQLMTEPGFQFTPDGRPLLFMFQFSDQEASACGGWANTKANFDKLRSLAKQKGLLEPYLVLMDFDPSTAWSHAKSIGFDAISSYAIVGGDNSGTPFQQLALQCQNWWKTAEGIGADIVPIVGTGWDPRPRASDPNPFVDEGPGHYDMPTPSELQSLVSASVAFTCQSPKTPAKAVIIYAWNELNENGAAIIPTIGNGTLYVDALQRVLPGKCS
jgi:hypothetical protein